MTLFAHQSHQQMVGKLRLHHPTRTALQANIHAVAGDVVFDTNITRFQIKLGMMSEI
ncbi:MAG: hypothetical protein HOP25_09025 [Methylotenera sp.]|nr:hypothetical protein [Methylotenera sp.]